MGFCPISLTKFVGTISLGLLTGVSYNLTTLTLPSLALLPSASLASKTLTKIQTQSTRSTLTLASISSLSLITAYTLASPRGRHPYLLWTALVSFIGGQGVEWWYNGFQRFPSFAGSGTAAKKRRADGQAGEAGYVAVEIETDSADAAAGVNGEKVEAEMGRERRVQAVRTLVSGVGFFMGVVGIWGDGA